MSRDGVSTFGLQAAILAGLGMGAPGARQWLSDTWLLAERTNASDLEGVRGLPPTASGGFIDGVYRELEAIERIERARVLRAALRSEVRRTCNERKGSTSANDLRAAALDLVLPCRINGEDARCGGSLVDDHRDGSDSRARWRGLAQTLHREATRPVSERLFGPRGYPSEGASSGLQGSSIESWDILEAICGAAAIRAVDDRTPPVEDALWGLMQLASKLGPGVDAAIVAVEFRLVLGAGPSVLNAGNSDSEGIDLRGPFERIELARLVVSGKFGEALAQSGAGELGEDLSPSLGALRAALRHRLRAPKSPTQPVASKRPGPGEIRRIARFLGSLDEAWPSPRQNERGALRVGDEWFPGEVQYLGRFGMMESGS